MQLVLDIGLTPEPSFERFCPSGNEAVVQCLQQGVAQLAQNASAGAPAPVYLWGDTGTGKSHLLDAVALALQAHGLSVGRLGPGGEKGPAAEFSPDWRAVLLDDVQALDAARQQQAFNWLVNARHNPGGAPCWVVAAGSAPPVDLALREDLRTRLGAGLSFGLHALDDGRRQQVLQEQARARGLHLSDEAAHYLLTRVSRDLSSLSALLARLDAHALQTQRALTIPLLRQVLQAPQGLPQEPQSP